MSESLLGDIRLDKIEICHASLGGAYIHDTNLGWLEKDEWIKFERCDLEGTKIINCNLDNVEIESCSIKNFKIDGILIEELVQKYKIY